MNDLEQDEQIKELYLLQRITQRINSLLELDELLEEVVSDVARTFGYSRSAVLLKDDATDEVVIAAVRGWTVNYHMKGDRFKIGEYGLVGHVGATGETYYAPDVTVDPYYEISEESTRSELDIPLKIKERLIGVFNFQHHEYHAFSPGRIQLLQALAGHVATAIENARLFQQVRSENEGMVMELEEARNIQTSLFPKFPPELPGFEISGFCLPCRQVGGDWFDFIPLVDGRLAVVLADVSGKGMGAALLMASTRGTLRLFASQGLSPSQILEQTNKVLITDFPKTKFVTMIYAVIDPIKRTVVMANAGHLPPLYINSCDSHFLTIPPGFPLGIRLFNYTEHTFELPQGSRLLLFSDGVNEATNSLSEEYGMTRMQLHMMNPKSNLQSLLCDLFSFLNGRPAKDDLTLVLIDSLS